MPRKKKEDAPSTASAKKTVRRKSLVASKPKKAAPVKGVKAPALKRAPRKSTLSKKKPAETPGPRESVSNPSFLSSGLKSRRLPRQGQTQMVAFIRDPHCLFTYWEVAKEVLDSIRVQWGGEFDAGSRVLRVYQEVSQGEPVSIMEIQVGTDEMNRYVSLAETGGSYFLEVGQKSPSGRYATLARSNRVVTSSGAFSGMTDPRWEPPAGMLEYFAEEGLEDSAQLRGQGVSSADLSEKRKGRHSASFF